MVRFPSGEVTQLRNPPGIFCLKEDLHSVLSISRTIDAFFHVVLYKHCRFYRGRSD
jgi:hypothetical protein